MSIVGRELSPETNFSPTREEQTWIGKPWRRITLLTQRTFYKGDEVDVVRDLTFHLGLRRIGLAFTLTITRQTVLDYSEEPQ